MTINLKQLERVLETTGDSQFILVQAARAYLDLAQQKAPEQDLTDVLRRLTVATSTALSWFASEFSDTDYDANGYLAETQAELHVANHKAITMLAALTQRPAAPPSEVMEALTDLNFMDHTSEIIGWFSKHKNTIKSCLNAAAQIQGGATS